MSGGAEEITNRELAVLYFISGGDGRRNLLAEVLDRYGRLNQNLKEQTPNPEQILFEFYQGLDSELFGNAERRFSRAVREALLKKTDEEFSGLLISMREKVLSTL
ncbi:MAG: hypothetical protein HYS32_02035 [Candidatus Woesearchaeota archaeon]|nr:MAG: hypothetical protein HYS32_02035 [Candidatus Woesearchaeota archaeon]